jgi:DNA-binding NarL/FixJ family response regulator
VARHQPDACLLDFRFHEGGDGVGAARAIRDKSPGTAVLVVSDSGSRVASLAATQAGPPSRVKTVASCGGTPSPSHHRGPKTP